MFDYPDTPRKVSPFYARPAPDVATSQEKETRRVESRLVSTISARSWLHLLVPDCDGTL